MKIEQLTADGNIGGNTALSCIVGAFRYHLWVDSQTLNPTEDVLHKNPVERVPGSGNTHRALDANAKANAPIVAALIEAAPRLVAEHRAKQEAQKAKRKAEHEAAVALQRIKDAGPELLAALRDLAAEFDAYLSQRGQLDNKVLHAARATIAKVQP